MKPFDVMEIVYVLIPMILSLTVHEYFHAWLAAKLGDDTAIRHGRLTLNPMAHIDPIGTLLIPIVGMTSGVPFFGWAKPVPISPVQFTRKVRMKTGVLLTSSAGPLSNLVFGFLVAVALSAIAHAIGPEELLQMLQTNKGITVALVRLLGWTAMINVGLFVFNLLPIPPLDGSHVLENMLPPKASMRYRELGRFAPLILFGVLMADRFLQIGIVGKLLDAPIRILIRLFMGI